MTRSIRRGLFFTASCTLTLMALSVIQAKIKPAAEKPAPPSAQQAKTNALGGSHRLLTYVSTDRSIYKPGDKLYVRAVVLDHATRKPLDKKGGVAALINILGPKGDIVAGGSAVAKESVAAFSWEIPKTQAGGQYTVRITHPAVGDPPAERNFDIRVYRAPRLKSQIKFIRDGYGAGDEVVARLHTERAEGGIPVGAKVTVIARVDGREAFRGPAKVNAKGNCVARFKLPTKISRGEGTLAMVIADGGIVETASKTIPILLQTIDLSIYPEGGHLVAGVSNRVYFEGRTPAKKPADIAGVVVNAAGKTVGKFRSEHDGRGRLSFTPTKGQKYSLKITEPSGINRLFPLPEAKPTGVVLRADKNVYAADEAIMVHVATTGSLADLSVSLAKREKALALVKPNRQGAARFAKIDGDGVLIVTVWNKAGTPLAERLIYRQPERKVSVKITPDARQYVPGGRAKINVITTDENGKPISAIVGLTVTDDSVLQMVDNRDQPPRLPVMVLLEGEVRELADAHLYLDPNDPLADTAVDLLLGTQGWRRFAFVDTKKFITQYDDNARRVLALRLSTRQEIIALAEAVPHDDGFAVVEKAQAAVRQKAGEPRVNAVPPENILPPADPAAKPAPVVNQPVPAPELQAKVPAVPKADPPLAGKRPPLANQLRKRFAANGARRQENKKLADALDKAEEQALEKRDILAGGRGPGLFRRIRARQDFVAVRVYAHQVRPGRQPGDRVDFAETLFWHAGLKTDENGQASFEFALNDSVTSFQVAADAFSSTGGIGSGTMQIDSIEPFYVEPKLPLEITMGDTILLPLGLVNGTTVPLKGVRLSITAPKAFRIASLSPLNIAPGERLRQLASITAGQYVGPAEFVINAKAGAYADRVTRTVNVQPLGFPMEIARGGLIGPGAKILHEVKIPRDVVPGSVRGRVVVYPTPLANMQESLARLIREPCGCFEQTSSSTYPLVMAQQYFMSHQGVDPMLIEKSAGILDRGYKRLTGFECKSGGYEWFGNDPGHDALTAYGLLEFTDMSKVHNVDTAMLDRTRKWLLSQRDGKGGYARKTRTLHTWLPDPEIASAYDTWALLSAGIKDGLDTEVEFVRKNAEKTENTYVAALGANVLLLAGEKDGTTRLLDKLAGKQQKDGSLSGATRSVVGSTGNALTIETTALAVTAWLGNKHYVANVQRAIKFLAESCESGRYGSTQSTVLALRAIIAYDASRAVPKAPGSLQLIVDGQYVGKAVKFGTESHGAIELPGLTEQLLVGNHRIQVAMTGGSTMPYSVAVDYHSLKPNSSEASALHITTKLRDVKIDEGAATEAAVSVVNRTNEDTASATAIVGIPGGLEVRHDQLKELVKEGKIAAYEVLGREVVLYWRTIKAEQRIDLSLSLVAAVPGKYTGPASRAYLYYTDEHKHWVGGLLVEITPKR